MKRKYQSSHDLDEGTQTKVVKELRLGYMNLSEGMFEQAKINFSLALQFDSRCADAFWGQMLTKLSLKSEDALLDDPLGHKSALYLPECRSALEFASDEQRAIYEKLLEGIVAINSGDNY
jgi:hypothetical protein